MYLTVSREEVENLIREKYNLPDEVKVYIKDNTLMVKNTLNKVYGKVVESNKDVLLYHDTDSIADMTVTVNNENQVQDIVPEKKESSSIRLTPEEIAEKYEQYAQTVEDFLKGEEKQMLLPLEGMAPSTIRYRYNTAIKMYGYEQQCYASATDHNGKGHAKLVKKGKVNA